MRLHLTVEHLEDGTSKVLYAGQEVLLAEKALAESVTRGEAVRTDVFFNPVPVSIRYPSADKKAIAQRAIEAQERAESAAKAKAAEIEQKRSQAKALTAEAKKLESELKA